MMSFRNASLFALISVSLVLAVTTFSLWYTLMMFGGAMGFAFPLSLWIELGVQFATPLVVLFVMVSSLRKRTLDLNRVLATIFMVVTAGVLIHFGYKQIEGASRIREFSDLPGLVLQLVGYAGLFGCALCLFLRPVRKNATSWFLIIDRWPMSS